MRKILALVLACVMVLGLIACGNTMLFIVVKDGSPSALPASVCPISTALIPPRMISATYAPELRPKPIIPTSTGRVDHAKIILYVIKS